MLYNNHKTEKIVPQINPVSGGGKIMRIGLGELIFSLFSLLPLIIGILLVIALIKYLRKK